ncbi:unnamed protein product [Mucor hiemalis]
MSRSNDYIQSVSYAKLAEYDQNRTDLPIRKYVLIANLLREEQQQQQSEPQDSNMNMNEDNEEDEDENMLILEQQWFETCLNELDKEDDDYEQEEENKSNENNGQYNHQNDNLISINQKLYNTNQPRIQLHAIYDIHSKRGILLCTSSI